MTEESATLTVAEAAKVLGISLGSAYDGVKAGGNPARQNRHANFNTACGAGPDAGGGGQVRPSYIERLLAKHRKSPSPTCRDPRQIDLLDYVKELAFKKLGEAIGDTLKNER
jgi:hypothetical protein